MMRSRGFVAFDLSFNFCCAQALLCLSAIFPRGTTLTRAMLLLLQRLWIRGRRSKLRYVIVIDWSNGKCTSVGLRLDLDSDICFHGPCVAVLPVLRIKVLLKNWDAVSSLWGQYPVWIVLTRPEASVRR